MSFEEQQSETRASVFLKRIREGYTWSIFVGVGTTEEEILEASRVAKLADEDLDASYPREELEPARKPRRR